MPAAKRRRGRPRGGETGAREQILRSASDEFGELGYDAATVRGIGARAGVDPSLIHHYFGTKADLFAEVVDAPMRPDLAVAAILEGPRDELGARIVRFLLEAWEQPDVQKRGLVIMRAALGNRMTAPLLAEFLRRELIERIATRLDVVDADLRATLVASQIAGLIVTRYVLRLPAIAEASVDELVDRVGPTVQRYLTE